MKKEKLIVGLGVATAMVAGFNNKVKADEVTPVNATETNTTQSKTVKEVAPTESDVKNAEVKLNEATDEVKNAQKVVDDSQQVYSEALDTKNKADEEVKHAQEIANKATTEKIESAESDVTSKQEKVTQAEKTLADAKGNLKEAEDAYDKQQNVVNKAKDQVNKETEATNKAQDKVKEAENAFDSESLLKAQQEAGKLNTKVQEDQNKVNSLSNELSKAQQDKESLVENGNKKRSELEQKLNEAGEEYLTVVTPHELASNSVPESSTKTTPPEEKSFTAKNGETYYLAANEDVNFDGEKTETIVVDSEEYLTTPHVVDYRKVSEEVRNYLIELRKINGIDIPVPEVTDKALKYAKARTDEMFANDKLSHTSKLNKEDFGFKDATENISAGALPYKSVLSEKEIAYNQILDYFHDYNNVSFSGSKDPKKGALINYGHRTPLLAASGTGMAVESTSSENTDYENYGILTFISENGGVYSTFPSGATGEGLSYYLASVKNEDSNPDYSEYYFNGKRVKFLPKTTFRYIWNETTHPKNPAYTQAKDALETFNKKQSQEESVASEKISVLNNELTIAKETLNKDKQRLDAADQRVAELTKDNESKVQALKLAQSELAKQQTKLDAAQSELVKQEDELKRLENVKSDKSNIVKDAEQSLENAKNDLKKAKQYVVELKNAPKILEEAEKRLSDAQAKLEEAKKALDDAVNKLNDAKAKQEKAEKEYTEVYEAYKQYIKAQQEAKLQAELKRKYDIVISKGIKPIIVSDEKGNIIDYKEPKTTSIVGTENNIVGTENNNDTNAYGEKNTVLPKTGDRSDTLMTTLGTLLISMFGFVGVRRKKN
jgi:LPXTG-motif cell wall-anchored protein